jgi:hypothetical protein
MTATGAKVTGTVNGDTVDRLQAGVGDYQSILFVIQTATITDGSHAFTVQDSDDGTTWATAATTDVGGTAPTLTLTDDDVAKDVGYVGPKRYARLVAVSSGTTTGGIFGALAVLFGTAGWRR